MHSQRENVDGKAEFRKPSNDTTSRKYRRRSPVTGLSSYDGSPHSERSSSPIPSRKDIAKVSGDKQRKGDDRDLGRDSGRVQNSHSGGSYKDFDRYISKSSHHYNRHDEYNRRDMNVDDYDRDYSKLSSRRGRDSGDYHSSSYSRHENRPRDYPRDMDKYSRYKSDGSGHRSRDKEEDSFDRDRDRNRHKEDRDGRDGKIDHQRSSRDLRSDRSPAYEDLRGLRNNSSSRRDCSGLHLKEAAKRDTKELDGDKYNREEKKIHEDQDRCKERHYREPAGKSEDGKTFSGKVEESLAKKPKTYSLGPAKDDDEKQSSTSKQTQDTCETVSAKQTCVTDSDIDAAKIAAMKAAELVNRNLIGTGYMSADQKKKLLWGNKKNTTSEESVHRWDTATFGDRERQEKFIKLMSLRLPWYLWPISGRERRGESRAQTRQSRYGETAGAAPVRFGEAIHCWTASERWSNSWTWSLNVHFIYLCTRFNLLGKFSFGIALVKVNKLFRTMLHFYFMAVCWSVIVSRRLLVICYISGNCSW